MRSELVRRAVLLLVALAPAGCLLDWDSLRQPDAAPFDAETEPPVVDDGGADTSAGDAGDDAEGGACQLALVINEVQTDGPQGPSDEFVELRNGAPCGGSLSGWGLRYSSAAGSPPNQVWTGQPGDTIGPRGPTGYVLLGGYAFQAPDGGVIGRISATLNGQLAKAGGGVGLFAPGGALVDGVAYETLTTETHPFLRPANAGSEAGAPNPPTGMSIARTPDGSNSNHNATDFQIATPTPGAPN